MDLPELQWVRGIEGGTGSAEAGGARGNSKHSVASGGGEWEWEGNDLLCWIWSKFAPCCLNFGREGAENVIKHESYSPPVCDGCKNGAHHKRDYLKNCLR